MVLKNIRETPSDRALAKVQKYLRDNALIAVPFDKGVEFSIMKKNTCAEKLEKVLDCEQFRKLEKSCDNIEMKNEKKLNKELLDMRKKGKIPVKIYEALRSTGAQPAKLYGLAKVHKKETPLRPVLSIPGSCFHKLNKSLSPFFQKIEGTSIETNINDARKTLEQIELEKNEQILSLNVKNLYTNVPVKEAINIALRSFYARDDKPVIPRTTMKRLLELAVTNVLFKCKKDGLAMGPSWAVILANLWMKSWEPQLELQTP